MNYTQEASTGELPEGWSMPRIKEILELKYGKGLRKSARIEGAIPVYGSNGVVGHHNEALTKGPTIVIGRKGTVGAVHFSPLACWPIDTTYFADDFHGLDPTYLSLALAGLGLEELDTSTAIPGLNRDDAYAQRFPLSPLAEQKRIVAQVEALLAKVNAARERLEKVPGILKRFRQSVLAAACSGQLTADWREGHPGVPGGNELLDCRRNLHREKWEELRKPKTYKPALRPQLEQVDAAFTIPESWTWASPDELCDYIVDCPHSTPKWTDEGHICLRTTNFLPGQLDLTEIRYVSEETYVKRNARLTPLPGDVLYSREGGILGIACMIPVGAKVCLGQRMMLMRTDHDACLPTFLMTVLNTPLILAIVREMTGGTASPHLNVGDIKQFPIPLAPLDEQQEIICRTQALFTLADEIEKRVELATKRAGAMVQSILRAAFCGELVPTEAELARNEGRDYEPASELLERIRAEREDQEKSAGTRTPKATRSRREKPAEPAENLGTKLSRANAVRKQGKEPAGEPPQGKANARRKTSYRVPAKPHNENGRPDLADCSTNEIMAHLRAAMWGQQDLTEAELLRAVAQRLGYARLGKNVHSQLKGHLRAAIRRGIVARDNGYVNCPTAIFRNYEDDFLRDALKSAMAKNREYTRDDVTYNLAQHLGFSQVTPAMRERIKAIFNSAIRRGLLGHRGQWVWREE